MLELTRDLSILKVKPKYPIYLLSGTLEDTNSITYTRFSLYFYDVALTFYVVSLYLLRYKNPFIRNYLHNSLFSLLNDENIFLSL